MIDRNGIVIDRNGLLIHRNGIVIDRNGIVFDRNGMVIDRNGFVIDRNGFIIDRNGILIHRNGIVIDRNRIVSDRTSLSMTEIAWASSFVEAWAGVLGKPLQMLANDRCQSLRYKRLVLSTHQFTPPPPLQNVISKDVPEPFCHDSIFGWEECERERYK